METIVQGAINGIDISSVQGVIDARAIAGAGFQFAYVKSSQYSRISDGSFDRNVEALRLAGIYVGAYHFCAHDTDPVAQMEFFYRASGGLGSKPGELPPMLDWEFCTPSKYPNHPVHCVDWLEKASKHATKLWYPNNSDMQLEGKQPRLPILYTFPNYASTHQNALGESSLGEYQLCYASYRSAPDGKGSWKLIPWLPCADESPMHAIPKPWTKWVLWQYSGNNGYRVPGISGDCDRQVFNGSSGEFQDLLGIDRPVDEIVKDDL